MANKINIAATAGRVFFYVKIYDFFSDKLKSSTNHNTIPLGLEYGIDFANRLGLKLVHVVSEGSYHLHESNSADLPATTRLQVYQNR